MRALFVTLLAIVSSFAARAAEPVNVAAAISMRESLREIGKLYEQQTGQAVTFTFGASGQLMAQIRNGASIDAFISAAAKQIDDLDKAKLIDPATRRDVAGNELVLIVPSDDVTSPNGIRLLTSPGFKRLAIGEPKTVPAGQYAEQTIAKLGLAEKLAGRIVYGANVRQVLDYVARGEVSAGIVYRSDVVDSNRKARPVIIFTENVHEPIRYPAAVIAPSKHADAARAFLDYLGSDRAIAVFTAHGFTRPPRAEPVPANK